MDGRCRPSDEVGRLFYDSKRFCSNTNGSDDAIKGPTQMSRLSKTDPSKEAQLMEALRHSQTRAREAERVAQQAYTEKEHIIKLFFRQAYHLFVCKQWLLVLQLETLLQPKAKGRRITFSPFLPWMSSKKAKQLRKGADKVTRRRVGRQKYDIGKYAVAIVVGMSLVGAGLFLGWTMGWLLPAF
ncbi:uncharacterized protein LOC131245219 [Magnolia sinica]|uniref:uncharacterized protein LOC131245219 n=1 Tax=Magnolia sinica TaxID=86752 RepID=UPI00265A9113|nr:uncharacterized protein LOC131245219 [Magnolia sinica]